MREHSPPVACHSPLNVGNYTSLYRVGAEATSTAISETTKLGEFLVKLIWPHKTITSGKFVTLKSKV